MAARADAERDRLRAMLAEACGRLGSRRARSPSWSPELLADHPDADGVIAEAQALTDEVIAWTARAPAGALLGRRVPRRAGARSRGSGRWR